MYVIRNSGKYLFYCLFTLNFSNWKLLVLEPLINIIYFVITVLNKPRYINNMIFDTDIPVPKFTKRGARFRNLRAKAGIDGK